MIKYNICSNQTYPIAILTQAVSDREGIPPDQQRLRVGMDAATKALISYNREKAMERKKMRLSMGEASSSSTVPVPASVSTGEAETPCNILPVPASMSVGEASSSSIVPVPANGFYTEVVDMPARDSMISGDIIGTISNYNVHLLKDVCSETSNAATAFDVDALQLEEIVYTPEATRRLSSIVFSYQGLLNIDAVFARASQLLHDYGAGWFIGHSGERTVMYIFKTNLRMLPGNISFNDIAPKCYKIKKGRGSPQNVIAIQKTLTVCKTNIALRSPCEDGQSYSFEQLDRATAKLNDQDFLKMKGEINLIPNSKKDDFHWAFLKSFGSLRELRSLRNRQGNLCFQAQYPPIPVVPLDQLAELEQTGTVLDEKSQNMVTHSLRSLFESGLAMRYAIMIGGGNITTGFGKSQFCHRLAIELALAITAAYKLPSSDAKVIVCTTLDVLRTCMPLSLGTVLIFDDFHLFDKEQIIHISEHGLKQLFNPRAVATMRARNDDITIPLGIPRLFTANVVSGHAWCGGRLDWSLPLQRRVLFFNISKRIVATTWEPDEAEIDDNRVAEQLRFAVRLPGPVPVPPEPAASSSVLQSAVRMAMHGFFGK